MKTINYIITYLMSKGISYSEAYNKTKKKRHIIKPNSGFVQQIKIIIK